MGVNDAAEPWRERSRQNLLAAHLLFRAEQYAACANRAYYAAYQAGTSLCVVHGDAFPNNWNNPSHEQLPGLIRNNGDLTVSARRQVVASLNFLRTAREDADYRPGRTVDRSTAVRCLMFAGSILTLLGVE